MAPRSESPIDEMWDLPLLLRLAIEDRANGGSCSELEYIAWSLPRNGYGGGRGRATRVKILPGELFNPGSYFTRPSRGTDGAWCMFFPSMGWMVLMLDCSEKAVFILSEYVALSPEQAVCNGTRRHGREADVWRLKAQCRLAASATSNASSHGRSTMWVTTTGQAPMRIMCGLNLRTKVFYASVSNIYPILTRDVEDDDLFLVYVAALNSLATRRFLQSPKVRPFGIGFDAGIPCNERLFLISHCAKLTPHLRRVTVTFEVLIGGTWHRVSQPIDRIGFALYKSAPKSDFHTAASPDAVHFTDDPYLRFARVTLRFGQQRERTVLDLDGSFSPSFLMSKHSATLSVCNVRMRTCSGKHATRPITTKVRLVFTNNVRRNALLPQSKSPAIAEAEKVLALMKRSIRAASQNSLGLDDALDDDDVFRIPLHRVITQASSRFAGATLFMVPCYATNGLNLITQSRDGAHVLRQYSAS